MNIWRPLGALLIGLLASSAHAQRTNDAAPIPGQLPLSVTQFGGMNAYMDSAHLGPSEATTAQNVLTEHGYVEKRPGSILATNFITTVENFIGFVNQGGSWQMVAHSSSALYVTDFSSTPVQIATVTAGQPVSFQPAFNTLIAVDGFIEIEYNGTSTTTTAGFPQCQYLEFAYQRVWCAKIRNESNSEVRISSVGGQSYWTVPPDPTIVPNAPNFFYINYQDGQPITCMKNTPWGMVVGKNRSLWIIKGYDNTNWYIKNIDPSIGCVDNRSMQMVDGRLQFGSVDGIYSWQGAGPLQLESLPIDPIYQSARQSRAQQQVWTTQQQSDWQAGTLNVSGPGAPMSATMDPGYLIPSSFTFVTASTTAFTAGTRTNISTSSTYGIYMSTNQVQYSWLTLKNSGSATLYLTSAAITASGANQTTVVSTYTQSVGTFTFITEMNTGGSQEFFFLFNSSAVDSFGNLNGTGYWIQCFQGVPGSSGLYKGNPSVSSTFLAQVGADGCPTASTRWQVYRDSSGNFTLTKGGVYRNFVNDTSYSTPGFIGLSAQVATGLSTAQMLFESYRFASSSAVFVSAAYDTTLSTPTWGNLNVTISSGASQNPSYSSITFQTQTSNDGITWTAPKISTPLVQIPSENRQYIRWVASFTVTSSAPASVLAVPSISNVTILAATTGYYYSPVHFVGSDISAWGTFDTAVSLPSISVITGNSLTGTSTITYQVRSATYSFSATASAPSWTNQAPNTLITVSYATPTYVQWNGLLNFSNAEIAPIWNLASVNWNTGLPTAPAASAYLLHRYFLCLALSGANNDTCLVQQRTRDWVKFTGQSIGAFTLFNGTLYGGSGLTDGSAWREMQDGVYNDAGVPIDSIWASGDFMFGDPVQQKVIDEIWLDAQPSTGTTLSVKYAVDRSTSYVSKPVNLGQSATAINLRVPMDARYALGKYFRLMFENNENASIRLNAFTIWGKYKPRTD